jgi:hypothetical protein
MYPNQNPWISGNIHAGLKARATAYKEQDTDMNTYKKSCYDLWRDIKHGKGQCRRKVESYYWLRRSSDVAGFADCEMPIDAELPSELNASHARFKENME